MTCYTLEPVGPRTLDAPRYIVLTEAEPGSVASGPVFSTSLGCSLYIEICKRFESDCARFVQRVEVFASRHFERLHDADILDVALEFFSEEGRGA